MNRLLALGGAVLVIVGALVAVARGPRDGESRAQAAAETAGSIETAGVMEHLEALQRIADSSGGNRAAGTRGDRASREYVAGRLRASGYRVREQRVSVETFDETAAPRVTGPRGELRSGPDVLTMEFSGAGRVRGRIRPVAIDLGSASSSGCDAEDFGALRRGEVALLQRGTCTLRDKALGAQRAGAAAVLVVNDGRPGRTEPLRGSLGRPGVRIPALSLSTAAGRSLARGGSSSVEVRARTVRRMTANVLAESAGGPAQRVVMAGGHLDSVPAGAGINDNGSGVAALLEVAEQMATTGTPEGARIRFAFWGAEELGLVGSRHYVSRLDRAERRRIVAYVNLDMVGSPNAVRGVYDGKGRSAAVERTLRRALGGGPIDEERLGGSSDHAPFARAGIPVGGLFTGASERKSARQARSHGGRAGEPRDPCYHRPCDTLDNVDRTMLTQMARAAGAGIATLAGR